MSTVVFHNPGALDIRGATVAGLSAKHDEQTAIGKFGTGLKYAIASILRWHGAVTIETAGRKYTFSKCPTEFRGKKHDLVCMSTDGAAPVELGFTTHYGHQWEPWQVFRELYSNAKDEQGSVVRSHADVPAYASEHTIITVQCSKLAECYGERDTIILPDAGDEVGEDLRMLPVPSNFLYYRSVRVDKRRCLFTWNLSGADVQLTEDRSITNTWAYESAAGTYIQNCTNRQWISRALRATEAFFEAEIDYAPWRPTSEEFLDEAEQLWKEKGQKHLPSGVWSILCKHRKHVDAPELVQLTRVQQSMLDRAIELVERMGLPAKSYPITVVKVQKSKLGEAKNRQVYLSPAVFDQGTKQVVSTLYEEVLHLESGLRDCTYEMQTYLFNQLVSLYEEHVFKEAC